MTSLFIAVNLNEVELKQCKRCGSTVRPIDSHHVTYKPVKRVWLCRPCHIGITVVNGTYAQRYGDILDNTTRRRLFAQFMRNKWRMEQEDKPLSKLARRRNMIYLNRLSRLQEMFFKGDK